jgi:histidine decarboxylase
LEESIRKDKRPPTIVANVGTTMQGAIDRVEKIMEVLRRQNVDKFYIHCDAALMGMILPFIKDAPLFDFRLPIDSISVSGHKMIGSPIPCGIVIARKENVERIQRHIELIGAPDTTFSGSRNGHSVLFLWYAIRKLGLSGFQNMIESCLEITDYAVSRLGEVSWEAHAEDFSIIILIKRPSDALIKKWQMAIQGDHAHLVIMPNITKRHIDSLIEDLKLDQQQSAGKLDSSVQPRANASAR